MNNVGAAPRGQERVSLEHYLRRLGAMWLVPLIALATLLVGASIFQVHRQRSHQVADWAQHLAAEIDADLRVQLHGLQAMAAWARAETHPDPSLNDWYGHARAYDQTFDTTVALVDDQRQMLRHSRVPPGRPLPQLPKPNGRSAYQDALDTGTPQIGNPVPGPVLKTQVIPIVVPTTQGPAQALMGLVPASKVGDLLKAQRIPQGWMAALLDSSGGVIASTVDLAAWGELAQEDSRHAYAKTRLAPFTVVVAASHWSFYRTHIVLGGALVVAVGLAVSVAALTARRASLGLVAAVRGLIPQGGDDKPTPPAPIAEVETVRQALQRASEAERQAERAERERIARELHDGLQQDLAAARLDLEWAVRRAQAGEDAQEPIDKARQALDKVNQELRQVVNALRPVSLDTLGLHDSLAALVEQLQSTSGIQVEWEVAGDESALDRIPENIADAVYRIAQESLNNVRKHAKASFVHLFVDVTEPSRLVMSISDDGVGLPDHTISAGHGLRGMAERAQALKATLDIRRGHDGDGTRGTTVRLTVPIERA